MRRLIIGTAIACLTAGGAYAQEVSERMSLREARTIIAIDTPLGLHADRNVCANGKQVQVGENDLSQYEFCKAVLSETAKRYLRDQDENLIQETYKRWSWNYPKQVIQGVARAAINGNTEFIYVRSEDQQQVIAGLPCPLAYDVGFFYGMKNPTSDFAIKVTQEAAVSGGNACFSDLAPSSRGGFKAGVYDGKSLVSSVPPT